MFKLTYPFIVLLILLQPFSLKAQETTASMAGTVTEGQVPLSGALITAVHLPTGTPYRTFSRKDGRYNFINLKIGGPYSVTVSFVGYKQENRLDIMLLVGEEYKADFNLRADSKELTGVTVQSTKQGKVFNSNHTGPQEIIDREHINFLPYNYRTLTDATSITPSANGHYIGGRNALFNNVTLDGANFTNVFGLSSDKRAHISGQPITLDGIDQIQVNIAPYDVWMGGFAGTNVNVVSRSGTNKFRGSAYLYTTGPGSTGDKVGDSDVVVQSFTYARAGFTAGGPIIKDKLFFFINAERENFKEEGTQFVASNGSRSQGEYVSAASASTLDSLRQFLIDKYQYDPGLYQGYQYITRKDRMSVKIDWNIDTNSTFTFKYNYFNAVKDEPVTNNGAPRGYRQPSIYGLPFSGSGYTTYNHYNGFLGELNTNWSNYAANKLQVGYMFLRNYRKSIAGKDFPMVDIMDRGQTYTSFGFDPLSYNNQVNIDVFQVTDIFTLYKGSHEITIGTQNFIKRYKSGFAPYYAGLYRYNSLDDFYRSANDGVANARGYTLQYSLAKDGSFPYSKVNINEFAFFIQDKLRLKNNFIITYGLRLDVPVFQNTFVENPAVSSLTFRDGKQYDVGQTPSANILISPRLSFNWDVTKKVRTQLRGGLGLFAGPPPYIWLSNVASNNGAQLGFFQASNNNGDYPPVAFSPDIDAHRPVDPKIPTSYDLALIEKGFKYPQVLKTNLGIDRTLPGNIIATLEATYMQDIVAVYFQNVNLPSTGTLFAGPDRRISFTSPQIYSGEPVESVSNPDIGSAILMNNSHKGFAYLVSLELQKRVENFYFGAAYTYSQTQTVNDGGSLQPIMWSNRPVKGDPNANFLGHADFYLPHRFMAYGSFRKTYAKYFATAISFIFQAAPSGVGSYTYSNDINNDGIGDNDLMYIPKNKEDIVLVPFDTQIDPDPDDHRTPDQIWAQLDNFIRQDRYLNSHRGQYAERNAVVFPFFKQLDINISQDITFGNERQHTLRFSFDLINVGNFLNRHWGTYKVFTKGTLNAPYIASPLEYEGIDVNTGKPRFSFPYLDPVNEIPLTNSFTDDISIYSRWQGQFGIRYLFQ